MRLSPLLLLLTPVAANWFSSQPDYSSWDTKQLQSWLKEHNINSPKTASAAELQDLVKANWNQQYDNAQKTFQNLKDSAFDTWDESQLRSFLVEHSVVAPSGPKESLVVAAKSYYSSASSAASSATSAASAAASTAVYGDSYHQASKSASKSASVLSKSVSSTASAASSSASTLAAQASAEVARKLDDSKDYVYSTWDDNKLRSYLEDKGVIKTKQQATRDQLLAYMRNSYAAAANPVYNAWSDSYIHEWLVSHGIIKSDYEKRRDALVKNMNDYYYSTTDTAYSTWSDSDLKTWLVQHNVIKSDAQLQREKLQKLVKDNYGSATDTIWGAWTDSAMKAWLVENGYIRSDTQVKRDELVKLINQKYNDASAKTAPYLVWPDARLRAYLRNHGQSEDALPTSRPGLLQEVRIRWVQTTSATEDLYNRLRATLTSGIEIAEEKLGAALSILTGTTHSVEADAVREANIRWADAEKHVKSLSAEANLARKTGEAKIVKEKERNLASAQSVASSLSAEMVRASKKATAEL